MLAAGLLLPTGVMAATPDTIFGSSIPATVDSGDGSSVELGVKFSSEVSGEVTGMRFYKASSNTGTHIGSLWSSGGVLLASATFAGETASGWQQVTFSSPVAVAANTTYVAGYFAPKGHYSDTPSGFATASVSNPPLAALANSTSTNGVYAYTGTSTFPTSTYKATNYWVDVDFEPAAPPTAPGQVPGVAATAGNGSATLKWAAPSSGGAPTKYTITPYIGTTAQPTTTITGAPPATSATITGLAAGTAYTFTVTAANATGSGPASEHSGAVTPTAVPTAPDTIFGSSTPATVDSGDGSSVELGVKFSSEVSGEVTGIRFYKASSNTGTHIGSLWSSGGVLLASATFAGETASGWQQVTFSSPVAVAANTTYVAGYFAPKGHYSDTQSGFATAGVSNPPLAALANTVSANGVYAYTATSVFPTSAYKATNYWVDVDFEPAALPTAPSQVTGVAATAGTGSATLKWTAPSSGGAPTKYTITPYIGSTAQPTTTIAGTPPATSATITGLTAGSAYTFTVTAANAAGSGPASEHSGAVTPTEPTEPSAGAPVNTGVPVVTGTVATGQTLTTSNGTWTNSPTGFSYAWQDCATDGTDCSNIVGATLSTYTVASGDAEHTITAVVTAANTSGSASASASPLPLIDEFNGSSVQTNLWTVMDQQGDTSNEEVECFLPSQVAESGGFLTETLISHTVTCPAGTPNSSNPLPDESGAVQMKSVNFTYGTVVVRAKMGSGGNAWPAIWLLGASCQQPNWLTNPGYSCGWPSDESDAAEIDIAEIKGFTTGPGTVWQNLIASGGNQSCTPTTSNTNANYHTYELDWTPASVIWKIDGIQTCKFTSHVPTHPMFLIIETADPGGSLSESQVTSVDYAHISFGG